MSDFRDGSVWDEGFDKVIAFSVYSFDECSSVFFLKMFVHHTNEM